MPKLKNLSGTEIRKFLEQHGFYMDRQKGSHMTFKRKTIITTSTILVPNHRTIDRGTCHSIFKQTMRYIENETVIKFFYTD